MNCTQCGTPPEPGQRYCTVCGRELPSVLPRVCRRCGFANDSAANFCGGCGLCLNPVSAPAAAREVGTEAVLAPVPVAEKRKITALFCDLVDSTGLATALDPEDYRSVLTAYQQACSGVIGEFGGYVAQYLGDGIVAYFGYPRAREDDAERAVYAGLRAVAAVNAVNPGHGLVLRARVGIATGLVVIGRAGGSDAGSDMAVVGEAPHLAARLQSLAVPNSVVIGSVTHYLLGSHFAYEHLGQHVLKGFVQPIEAWRVVGNPSVPSRLKSARAALTIPMVDREEERAILTRCASRFQDGPGQIVLIEGQAGIGKSRLAQEIMQWLTERQSALTIELRCSPLATESPFHPLIQWLNRVIFAGCRPLDAMDAWSGIRRLLSELRLDDPDEALPLFAGLLAIPLPAESSQPGPTPLTMTPLTPERQRRLVLRHLLSLMLRRTEGRPLLLLIEDLQWADPSTLDFVAFLAAQTPALPVLCLFTAQPGFNPPWFLNSNVSIVALDPLDPLDAGQLLLQTAGAEALPPEVIRTVLETAGGIPLHVEELAKAMVDARGRGPTADEPGLRVPLALPDTVLMRLDALGEARTTAQRAAVIGREFSLPLLSAAWPENPDVLSAALEALLQAGMIRCCDPPAVGWYAFRHDVFQEVAYASLELDQRVACHARIGEVLEREFPETVTAEPDLLARHFTAANLPLRAVTYRQRAGKRALELAAHAEASGHFRQALALLDSLPDGRDRQRLELDLLMHAGLSLSVSLGYAAPEVEAIYRRVRELGRAQGDAAELYPVLRRLSTFYAVRADLSAAKELAQECIRLGHELRRADYLIGSYDALGYALMHMGELAAARAVLMEAIDLYRTQDGGQFTYLTPQHPAVACLCLLAILTWMVADERGARQYAREAVETADQLQRPFDQAYAHCFTAVLETLRREPAGALEHANRAIELSQHYGYAVLQGASTLLKATAQGLQGSGEAITVLVTTLETWQASGAELNRPFFLAGLAEVYRANGMLEDALASVDQAIEHAAQHHEHFFDAILFQLRGELLALGARADEAAESQLERAIEVARRQGALLPELRAATSLHKLCVAKGRPEASRATLEAVCTVLGQSSASDTLRELQDARTQLGMTAFSPPAPRHPP